MHTWLVGPKPDEVHATIIKRQPSRAITPASQNEAQTSCDLSVCWMQRGWFVISEEAGDYGCEEKTKQKTSSYYREDGLLKGWCLSLSSMQPRESLLGDTKFRVRSQQQMWTHGTHRVFSVRLGVIMSLIKRHSSSTSPESLSSNSTPCRGNQPLSFYCEILDVTGLFCWLEAYYQKNCVTSASRP